VTEADGGSKVRRLWSIRFTHWQKVLLYDMHPVLSVVLWRFVWFAHWQTRLEQLYWGPLGFASHSLPAASKPRCYCMNAMKDGRFDVVTQPCSCPFQSLPSARYLIPSLSRLFSLGNSMGRPGVFFDDPHPHPPIPVPAPMGAGFPLSRVRVFTRDF
jgi:hypothetical protein